MVDDSMTDEPKSAPTKQNSGLQAPIFGLDKQLNTVRKSIKKVTDSKNDLQKKSVSTKKNSSSKRSKSASSKQSLERIDFSYSKKLRELSNSVKKQKALSKFDGMEEHIVKSGITLKKTDVELSELSKLIHEFNKKELKMPSKKTTSKKNISKK